MRQAMSAGARDYLVKPFDSDELFKTIETVAKREQSSGRICPLPPPHRRPKQARRMFIPSSARKAGSAKA